MLIQIYCDVDGVYYFQQYRSGRNSKLGNPTIKRQQNRQY